MNDKMLEILKLVAPGTELREGLENVLKAKTGALIVASVKAGLCIGGANEELMANMTEYAENLGLAYQITDDILDVKGNEQMLGKKTNVDAGQNKVTYVSLNGLEKSERKLEELTDNAVKTLEKYYDNAEFFRDLVKNLSKRSR